MIIFDSVYRTFDPDDSGVKDVSFSVDPGELVMVTGHSGSGKTTLMRLLTKEYTPEAGEITFNGTLLSKIKKSKLHEHRRKIGVVFQDYRLVPEMNVWENIALPLAVAGKSQADIEERVTDLLKLVQLPEKAHLFPSQLSGGEAQRISIARALANAPTVIFADEPTGNLDQDTSQSIAHLLKQINELGTTLIFATHDPKILSIFSDERHIHLKEGTIEFDTKEKNSKKEPSKPKKTESEDLITDSSSKKETEATKKPTEKTKKDSETKEKDTSQKDESSKKEDQENKKEADTKTTKTSNGGFFARLFGKKESVPPEEDDFEIEIEMVETEDTDKESNTEDSKDSGKDSHSNKVSASEKKADTKKESTKDTKVSDQSDTDSKTDDTEKKSTKKKAKKSKK